MHRADSRQFAFDHLHDGERWHHDIILEVDAAGDVLALRPRSPEESGIPTIEGWAVPGMPNLHSHSFQRAMAGFSEYRRRSKDSFWTWRELMYRLAGSLTPEQVQVIARHLYIELLEAGYTAVCEFHYLHNDRDGRTYENPAELCERHLRAAEDTGIGLTLLPVLYQRGGFRDQPLGDHQRRFHCATADYLDLLTRLASTRSGQVQIGSAFHSLRAVDETAMREVLGGLGPEAPIHIHIAEQQTEVADCLAVTGQRPVDWLLERFPVDRGWVLIHATHLDDAECEGIASTGAVAGLCPTTEANLGDGLFPLASFLRHGGTLGIGSDSHVSVSPIEELRWLEYGQRLTSQRRIIACRGSHTHVGDFLWTAALAGGGAATGRPVGRLVSGHRADLVVLRTSPREMDPAFLFDRMIFADRGAAVDRVMVGGKWVVQDGRHADREQARSAFETILAELAL
ncbi:MAG: formimidoylglutamate deiminase [Xanthomonadales bacterium]|nr:formimidoylglutamate deiminase [Xanthomonadales bacterium]